MRTRAVALTHEPLPLRGGAPCSLQLHCIGSPGLACSLLACALRLAPATPHDDLHSSPAPSFFHPVGTDPYGTHMPAGAHLAWGRTPAHPLARFRSDPHLGRILTIRTVRNSWFCRQSFPCDRSISCPYSSSPTSLLVPANLLGHIKVAVDPVRYVGSWVGERAASASSLARKFNF